MPKPVQYKKNSLVYFNGDKNDNKIFVLQQGKILLESLDPETNIEVLDTVAPGEFFGVKSSLGNFPRDETATVAEDSIVIVFSVPEFEALATSNTRLIFKMLQVFSNQLRRVNKQLASVLKQKEVNADDGLFNSGEFFYKQNKQDKAAYIFKKYIEQHPNGKNIDAVNRYLKLLQKLGVK
ncbi:MAG: hypothetical protein Ta2F_17180 [Termitinemataceae bacterium]|nr:MAG: hypothetical protein Ta2F_17180 [Termitinemataceae bacterium]